MSADVAEVVGYNEDSASPQTVLKPASFAATQMLVFIMGQDASGGLASLTTPSGWTDAGTPVNAAGVQARCWYHVYNGADPGSWDFGYASGADVAGQLFRVTGADVTTPTIVVASTTVGASSGSMSSPSVTPTGSDDLAISAIMLFCANNTLVETDPAGWTDRGQSQLLKFQAIASVSKQLVSPSATGTLSWTSITPANAGGGAFTIAIKSTSSVDTRAQTGRAAAAGAAAGTAQKISAATGRAVAAGVSRAAATKAAALSGTGAAATTARTTAAKTAAAGGRAVAAILARYAAGDVRAQTGTARAASRAAGVAAKTTATTGQATAAGRVAGTATAKRGQAGTAAAATRAAGAVLKKAAAAGTARAAATAAGATVKHAAAVGRAVAAVIVSYTASPSTAVGLAGEAHGPDAHPPGAVDHATSALAGGRTGSAASTGQVDHSTVSLSGSASG